MPDVLRGIVALRLRRVVKGEWLMATGGLLSIAFGLILAVQPGLGTVVIMWILGCYALLFGVILVALGLRLRRWIPPEPFQVPEDPEPTVPEPG